MSESKDQSTDSTGSPGLQSRGEPQPPSFKEKIHRFFFLKGLADRPPYLQEIYDNTPRTVFYNYDLPDYMIDSQGRCK